MKIIDLRSDTVTRPSKEMRLAMMNAEVGDDVFGEDPTVNRLQARLAEMFGKAAALFVPSGVMGNQVCLKTHTSPGDEIILEQDSHIFVYENAAPAALSGVSMKTLAGERGVITAAQIKTAIRPKAYYLPRTKVICIENTHGRAGGTIFPVDELQRIRELALDAGIAVHLDGARLWNAAVASGVSLASYASYCDSLSVCLSKGLGAPVGSVILGSKDFIEQARTYRKMFGGGMRQAGILAAAGLYAVDHNVQRLSEDHANARILADLIAGIPLFQVDRASVQTNMVIAQVRGGTENQMSVLKQLESRGVLLTPEHSNSIRAVTHLDVSVDDVREAARIMSSLFA